MSWKVRPESGLLVPASPFIRNQITGPEMKPANRKTTGEVGKRITPTSPNDLRYFAQHVRGRSDAAAEMMVNLAFLKSKGMAKEHETVTSTGAVYQDKKGTPSYPRAHRFPCNPMVGYNQVPELANWSTFQLRNELKIPLAITDPLPTVANYADRLFESSGMEESVVHAVRWILTEQGKDKPVDDKLIRHVIDFFLQPSFTQGYEAARARTLGKDDEDLTTMLAAGPTSALTDENLNELYRSLIVSPSEPTQNLDAVRLLLSSATDVHHAHRPSLTMTEQISQRVDKLETLSQGDDMAASHDKLPSSLQAAKRPVAR